MFYIRISKIFHVYEFCITLLCLSWSCSNTLSTGCHFEPSQLCLRITTVLVDTSLRLFTALHQHLITSRLHLNEYVSDLCGKGVYNYLFLYVPGTVFCRV